MAEVRTPIKPELGKGGLASFLVSLTTQLKEAKQQQQKQKGRIEEIQESERLRRQRPGEKLDATIADLVQELIPREPTKEEVSAEVPEPLRKLTRQPGAVATPGPVTTPGGSPTGVIVGRGQVAAGQPRPSEVLRTQVGQPAARAQLGRRRQQAEATLNILGRAGVSGTRKPTTEQFSDAFNQDFQSMQAAIDAGGDPQAAFLRMARVHKGTQELAFMRRAWLQGGDSDAASVLFAQ